MGRTVSLPAENHHHAVSRIHLHRNGENVLDLALKCCLARRSSWCNPIYKRHADKVQRVGRKPGVQRRKRRRIREPLDIEVLREYPAPSREQIEVIPSAPRFACRNRPVARCPIKRTIADISIDLEQMPSRQRGRNRKALSVNCRGILAALILAETVFAAADIDHSVRVRVCSPEYQIQIGGHRDLALKHRPSTVVKSHAATHWQRLRKIEIHIEL